MPTPSRLHGLAYSVLGERPARVYPWSASMREQLMRAGAGIGHIVYISSMFFWTATASAAGVPVSVALFSFILPMLGWGLPPSAMIVAEAASPAVAGAVTFLAFQLYPRYKASIWRTEIERNLVYLTNYMSILAGSGATGKEIFLSLARAGKVFGVERSARAIIRDVEVLGLDILTAIDTESKRSPSREYANLLQGYISTIATGGEIVAYLSVMTEKFLESRKRTMARMIDQLNLAGEIFIVALVALPIIMVTILSVMGFFGGQLLGGLTPTQLMTLMVYVMIPVMAIGILIFIDGIMSSG